MKSFSLIKMSHVFAHLRSRPDLLSLVPTDVEHPLRVSQLLLPGSPVFFLLQEYFGVPLSSLRSVLGSAHVSTVRLLLQYYDRNKEALQVGAPDTFHPQISADQSSDRALITLCLAAV